MDNMQGNEPMISEPVGAEPVGMGVDSAAPVFTDEKKSGKGMLLGLVLCLVLAVGGIGFGVWAMMDGNARADKLNKQITDLKAQIASMAEQGEEEPEEDTADYIYVGEWGIKIKIPSNLHKVSYKFEQHGNGQVEGSTLDVSGTVENELPGYANPYVNTNGLGYISRIPVDSYSGSEYDGVDDALRACGFDSSLVYYDDSYNYCYGSAQDVFSTDAAEIQSEEKSIELVKEMISNSENYSKI